MILSTNNWVKESVDDCTCGACGDDGADDGGVEGNMVGFVLGCMVNVGSMVGEVEGVYFI